jgi:NAD+ diphosphatase
MLFPLPPKVFLLYQRLMIPRDPGFGPLAFGGSPLDRAGYRRTDPAWLAQQHARGLFLPFWQDQPLLKGEAAAFLAGRPEWEGCQSVFLGLDGGQPLFAVALPDDPEPVFEDAAFQQMRAAAMILPGRDCAIAGQAKAMLDWHRRHRFCANCGAATTAEDGGYRRHCPGCGADHFPRTDPVVIMLPLYEDQCLVGRNARFTNGLYSAFAGFIEPGETVEDAVARELEEEAGMRIGAVTYHASQPWPFPSSLMIGCYAAALSRDFAVDGAEIAEARWMPKTEARARLAGEITDDIRMPTPIAIAHRLIRDWAEG